MLVVCCTSPVIIAHYAGGDQEAAGIWPGDGGELSPPPADHNTEERRQNKHEEPLTTKIPDIESEDKSNRDKVGIFLNNKTVLFKLILLKLNNVINEPIFG